MGIVVVGPDTFVTLSYVLFDASGDPVDEASDVDPLTYVHGYAQIVPALERGLEGLVAGDACEITATPEEGFGEHDEEGVFEVERSEFPNSADVVAGDEFVAQSDDGPIAMRVVEVHDEVLLVDTNHPLAGQTVRFQVKIKDVRPANEGEIAQAQAELEERIAAQNDQEECCGGDHDHGSAGGPAHEHGRLVTLSRKS